MLGPRKFGSEGHYGRFSDRVASEPFDRLLNPTASALRIGVWGARSCHSPCCWLDIPLRYLQFWELLPHLPYFSALLGELWSLSSPDRGRSGRYFCSRSGLSLSKHSISAERTATHRFCTQQLDSQRQWENRKCFQQMRSQSAVIERNGLGWGVGYQGSPCCWLL